MARVVRLRRGRDASAGTPPSRLFRTQPWQRTDERRNTAMLDRRTDDFVQESGGTLSRRTAIRRIGAGGVAALLAAEGVRRVAAQEDTPDIVNDWIDAWNSDDPAANLADLYTDDGVYEDVPTDTRSDEGQIADFLSSFIAGLSDIELELTNSFATDDWAAAEYDFSATNQGTFGDATGSFTVRVATIFELDDDEISRSSDYYDLATIANQLTPPPTPGTPTAAATEPPATEPAETAPAETEPAETEPAETEPAETEPAGTPEA
jgi:steroid delta-isomerase-like uncharacterized protein